MRRRSALALGVIAAAAAMAGSAHAATLQPIGTFSNPVFVTSEPDPDRLLVVEQGGRIQLSEDGARSLFLDIHERVTPGGEQGLLSMARAPDYATSKRFFVFYVDTSGNLQIDEYTAASIPVDTATRRPVLNIPHTTATNHNGGQLQFGPDGYLYISTGDGGNTPTLAQDTSVLLGKILRIDPDPAGGAPYSVPADNPFVGVAGADEIWSFGLRNPFRFSFDRATGALLIGDVGAGSREEVDFEPQPDGGRADNFGWNCREGFLPRDPSCSGDFGFTEPIHDYDITGPACAIAGGYVVRDPGLPELAGRYVYADFCVGQVRSLVPGLPLASDDRAEGLAVASPSSFGEDTCGRVYVASLGGPVSRLVGDAPTDCSAAGGAPPLDPGGGTGGAGGEPGGTSPPAADRAPPRLELRARNRQGVGDRRLACSLTVDEPATAVARLAIVGGAKVALRLDAKELALEPGRTRIRWKLSRPELRRLGRELRNGELKARFRARARDAAGNATSRLQAVSTLKQ